MSDETPPLTLAQLAQQFRKEGIEVNDPDRDPCRHCDHLDTISAWLPVEASDGSDNKGIGFLLFQFCPEGHMNLID